MYNKNGKVENCVCVCVWEREREGPRKRGEKKRRKNMYQPREGGPWCDTSVVSEIFSASPLGIKPGPGLS